MRFPLPVPGALKNHLANFSLWAAGRKGVLVLVSGVAITLTLLVYGIWLGGSIIQLNQSWDKHARLDDQFDTAITGLNDQLGYGGFIHHFKNFVIRGDEKYAEEMEVCRQKVEAYLNLLATMAMTADEQEALIQIHRTVELYRKMVPIVRRMRKAGEGVAQIDKVVRVDDTEGRHAMTTLMAYHQKVIDKASRANREKLDRIVTLLTLGGLLYIPLILIYSLFLTRFLRQITEANQTASRQRDHLEQLIDLFPDALLTLDNKGRVVKANPAAKTLFGQKSTELSGQDFCDLVPIFQEGWVKATKGWMEGSLELPRGKAIRLVREDGTEVAAELWVTPMEKNSSTRLVATLRDVTRQALVDEALRLSEDRLLKSQEIAHVGTWDWDILTNGLTWSDEVYRIFGDEPQSYPATYQSLLERIHPDDRDTVSAAVNAAVEHRQPYNVVHRLLRSNGEVRQVEEKGEVYRAPDGTPLRMLGVVVDITEKLEAELALLASERFHRTLFNSAGVAIAVMAPDGTLTSCNEQFRLLTGYSEAELKNFSLPFIVHPENLAAFQDHMEQVRTLQSESNPMTLRVVRKDNHTRWVDATLSAIRAAHQEVDSFVLIQHDITRQVEYQQELQRSRKIAEEATAAKSAFLANMSHEIRTPMNAIIGMGHLMKKTGLNPRQRDYLDKISSSSSILLGIINDILDFSKVEAGKMELEQREFSLSGVLKNLSHISSINAKNKELDILIHLHPDVPNLLVGDALRLGQVLINLTNNAIKFTEKGQVSVEVTLVKKSPPMVTLHVEVRDTGIGMSPSQQKAIFHPFEQADASTTRRFGGTGLGLAISSKLVELMGGRLQVVSELHKGSTFFFDLTLKCTDMESQAFPRLSKLHGMRVLLMDGNAASSRIMQDMLTSLGMEPTPLDSGQLGLGRLKEALGRDMEFDLIVLDRKLSGGDLNGFFKDLKSLKPVPPPVILLETPFEHEQTLSEEPASGILASLTKPVTPSTLFDALRQSVSLGSEDIRELEYSQKNQTYPGLSGIRVLVVEDNATNREMIQEILQDLGMVVTLAENGQQAVETITQQGNGFDVVLMDVQMPVMDGLEATRKIRQLPNHGGLPIIALTANAMPQERNRCLESGMNAHVAKPLEVDDLMKTMEALLEGKLNLDAIQAASHLLEPALADGAALAPPPAAAPAAPPQANGAPKEIPEAAPASSTAAAPASAKFLGRLAPLPGLNLEEAERRVLGKEPLYLRLLSSFQNEFSTYPEQINVAIKENQAVMAQKLVHTLKGVSGNLGAMRLFGAAQDLDKALKEGRSHELAPLLAQFSDAFGEVMKSIRKAVNSHAAPAPEGPSLNGPQLLEQAHQLETLLAANNLAAGELFQNIKASLESHEPEKALALEASLNGLNYQKGRTILKEIISSLQAAVLNTKDSHGN